MRLKGKTVLVTAAGRGMGRASALALAAEGARVIATDRDRALLDGLDGKRHQDGSTATMIFGVAHIVSYCSRFPSLRPGDVISIGTPPGVGMGQKPPVYLKGGETVRLGIEGLGEQRQEVRRA